MHTPTEWDWADFGAWCERDAFLLAKSRLEEQDARIAELEAALRNAAEWLARNGYYVIAKRAVSVLNKETSRA